MNFFEIINNCLLELNYRQVNNFSELIKNDHKKLISIINIINKEICSAHNWNFLSGKPNNYHTEKIFKRGSKPRKRQDFTFDYRQ